MKKAYLVLLSFLSTEISVFASCPNSGENCPLPAGASSNFTGDPCHLAVLNQKGSYVGSDSCPCTLVGLDHSTLTTKLTSSSKLIDCDLTNADLSGLDLSGVDFSGSTLTNANLNGCTLNNTNFQNTRDMSGILLTNIKSAQGAKFNGSGPGQSGAALYGATLSGNFAGAIFDGAGFAGATLDNSDFTGASFLDLTTSISNDTHFINSKGQTVTITAQDSLDLTGSVLHNVIFSNAKLNGIQFTDCVLNNVNFSGNTDLSTSSGSQVKTSFKNVNNAQSLQKNNLSLASLANPAINLTGANLSNADLSNANLAQVNATSTNFTNANLDGTALAGNFTSANFTNAIFTNNTTIANGNFTNATLNTDVAVYGPFIPFPVCVTNNTPGDFIGVINKNLTANVNAPAYASSAGEIMLDAMGVLNQIAKNIGTQFLSFYTRLLEICSYSPAGSCQVQFCDAGGCKCP